MKRFFAFGCSYVNYHYPTWADILIEDLKHKNITGYNCGKIGSGNQLISSRIWELYATQNFSEQDLIIISWSSFFREDRYHTGNGWHTPGNIFFHKMTVPMKQNAYHYTDENQWKDLLHCLLRDCAIITSTLEGLKNTGAKVISTAVLDPYIDQDLINFSKDIKDLLDMYKLWLYPQIIPIQNYCYYHGIERDNSRPKYKIKNDTTSWIIEDHATPLEHFNYLENVVCKELDIILLDKTKNFAKEWDNKLHNNADGHYPVDNWCSKQPKWIIN
jgi:hypothetical protein